jgi:hypothetical protein
MPDRKRDVNPRARKRTHVAQKIRKQNAKRSARDGQRGEELAALRAAAAKADADELSKQRHRDFQVFIESMRVSGTPAELEALDPKLRAAIESGRAPTLRERVGHAVMWGVHKGYVRVDEETELAYAARPEPDTDSAQLDTDSPFEATEVPQTSGASEASMEQLRRALAEMCERMMQDTLAYADLEYALSLGLGQVIALQSLGRRFSDPVYVDDFRATELARLCALVAERRGAPERVYADLRPTLEFRLNAKHKTAQPMWFHFLVFLFDAPLVGESAEKAVEYVLTSLCAHSATPAVFRKPSRERVREAQALVRATRVDARNDHARPIVVYEPEAPRRGRAVRPWTMAARFARCFGFIFPEREQDAKRRK